MTGKVIIIFLLTIFYTLMRYAFWGNVELIHMPVYLLNKAVSMAAVIFMFQAAVSHRKNQPEILKLWGTISFHTAIIHILLSFAILSREYYPKFFGPEKMNLIGEMTIFAGVLAAYFFWTTRNGKSIFARPGILQLLAALFVAGHLVTMGFSGWLSISEWPGYLPPISMISFIFAALSFIFFTNSSKN